MADVQMGGAKEFRELSRRLQRAAGAGVVSRAAQRGISASVPALTTAARVAASERLPGRGGLAARVAKTRMTTRVRTGRRAGVRITAEPNTVKDPASIDRGRVAHKTYGKLPWQFQSVRPGWFTDPMKAGAPAVRARIARSLNTELRQI